jgi:hypothetical protein
MLKIGKSPAERQQIEQMKEAVAKYDGPIRHCPPGVARDHESLATLAPNRANRTPAERHEQTTDAARANATHERARGRARP